jgi:hypothetical protein
MLRETYRVSTSVSMVSFRLGVCILPQGRGCCQVFLERFIRLRWWCWVGFRSLGAVSSTTVGSNSREPRGEILGRGFLPSPTAVKEPTNVRAMLNTNKWNTHIVALRNYVERTGSSRVPRNHVEATEFGEIKLGAWVSYVRHRQRKGHLSQEQAQELASLPQWQWGPLRAGRTGNPERDARIRERASNGARLREIADEFGITRQRVHQIISSK